jgi:hypothetical protein
MFTPVSVARTGVAWCRIVGGAMTAFAVLLEGCKHLRRIASPIFTLHCTAQVV